MTVPSPVRGGYRRGVSFALRVALAAAIVWWLIRRAGWEEIVATLGRADPRFLAAAAVAICFESVAKSWNWGRLLDSLGTSSAGRRAELWHVYMVASLVGSVLPSTASTDAMRGLLRSGSLAGDRPHTLPRSSSTICWSGLPLAPSGSCAWRCFRAGPVADL